ncbi:hypothetical protein ACQRWP_15235 [Micromonospora trifolii]|uniref:hypothetical protein n=1 Tax=Micromonospora trifolii TaxID=2911208 RepID=UPI003D2F3B66
MTFFMDEALPGRGWWVRRKSADASDLQVTYRCVGAHAAVVAMVSHPGIESQEFLTPVRNKLNNALLR